MNYLESEDTTGYLTFHKEVCNIIAVCIVTAVHIFNVPLFLLQQDGGYTLRGGPLDALIAYAASTTSAGIYVQCTHLIHVHESIYTQSAWKGATMYCNKRD